MTITVDEIREKIENASKSIANHSDVDECKKILQELFALKASIQNDAEINEYDEMDLKYLVNFQAKQFISRIDSKENKDFYKSLKDDELLFCFNTVTNPYDGYSVSQIEDFFDLSNGRIDSNILAQRILNNEKSDINFIKKIAKKIDKEELSPANKKMLEILCDYNDDDKDRYTKLISSLFETVHELAKNGRFADEKFIDKHCIHKWIQAFMFNIDPKENKSFFDSLTDEDLTEYIRLSNNIPRDIKGYNPNQIENLFYVANGRAGLEEITNMLANKADHSIMKNIIDKIDYTKMEPSIAEYLIGLSGNQKIALEFKESEQYKKMKEKGDYGSAEFLLATLGGDYRKLYNYYIRNFVIRKPKGYSENDYANDIQDLILENNPHYGVKILLRDKNIVLEDFQVAKLGDKYRSNVKLSKCKRKNASHAILAYDHAKLKDYYFKNIKKLSSIDKKTIIGYLEKKEENLDEFVQELIAHNEKFDIVSEFAEYNRCKPINSISVDNPSDISIEQMIQDKIDYVRFDAELGRWYSKNEAIEIKKGLERLLDGIPVAKNDSKSQLSVFKQIYKRVTKIKYDYSSLKRSNKRDELLQEEVRNLYGGLVKGKCVCVGYANILKVALQERGIEAKTIGGALHTKLSDAVIKLSVNPKSPLTYKIGKSFAKVFEGGHEWNQVKIGDTWFNCDATNIKNEEKALFSDKDFRVLAFHYYSERYGDQEECKVDYKDFLKSIGVKSVHTLKKIKESIGRYRKKDEKTNI